MFCPNCGAGEQGPNAYCKRCGDWLSDPKSSKHNRASSPEKRFNVMCVFNALSAALGLASAIILYATYLGRPEAKWSVYLAAAFCLVIAVHQTISFFFALEFRERMKQRRREMNPAIGSGIKGSVKSLDSGKTTEFVNPASVTENTTELLEPVPRGRKLEDR
jgi:hypothetical protein